VTRKIVDAGGKERRAPNRAVGGPVTEGRRIKQDSGIAQNGSGRKIGGKIHYSEEMGGAGGPWTDHGGKGEKKKPLARGVGGGTEVQGRVASSRNVEGYSA